MKLLSVKLTNFFGEVKILVITLLSSLLFVSCTEQDEYGDFIHALASGQIAPVDYIEVIERDFDQLSSVAEHLGYTPDGIDQASGFYLVLAKASFSHSNFLDARRFALKSFDPNNHNPAAVFILSHIYLYEGDLKSFDRLLSRHSNSIPTPYVDAYRSIGNAENIMSNVRQIDKFSVFRLSGIYLYLRNIDLEEYKVSDQTDFLTEIFRIGTSEFKNSSFMTGLYGEEFVERQFDEFNLEVTRYLKSKEMKELLVFWNKIGT